MALQSCRDQFERWLADPAPRPRRWQRPLWSADRTVLVDAGWDGQAHRLVVRLGSTGQFETRLQYLTLQRLGTQLMRPDGAVGAVVRGRSGAPRRALLRDAAPRRPDDGEVRDAVHVRVVDHRRHCGRTRSQMQTATLEQLARVHAAMPSDFAFLDRRRPGESALAAHVRSDCRTLPGGELDEACTRR